MLQTLRIRIAAITSVFVLVTGFVMALGSSTALASSGQQFCTTGGSYACLNAWSGGPFVKVYTSRGTSNNDFLVTNANGHVALTYVGTGSWNGKCVGDAYNQSGNSETSLDTCPTPGGDTGGWGVNFDLDSNCAMGFAYKNVHWNNYLAPGNYTNGTTFFLNSPIPVCFFPYAGV